jgi:hypothetical protein
MRGDPASSSVSFGAVSERQYNLSDAEKEEKAAAAAAPLEQAERVHAWNQEVKSELHSLREGSAALAELAAVRQLIGGSPTVAPGEPQLQEAQQQWQQQRREAPRQIAQPEMEHRHRDSMAESMSRAREELLRAESLVNSPAAPGASPQLSAQPQRPNTWSNVPVELSAEEQEEIRHRIYGSLLGAADSPPAQQPQQPQQQPQPHQHQHQHPVDAEESALREERAEASRLRAALMRFDQEDTRSNSSLLSDADVQAERDRCNTMASHLERMAYETERTRLQDAEQLAADEQELQRLKAEIARSKQNEGAVAADGGRQRGTHETAALQAELARAKNELSGVRSEEATLESMRAKEVDLLQQTLKASQRRCSALDEEVEELRGQLERNRTGGGGGGASTEELEAELAKERALRERYAALCVKLESACESPARGGMGPGAQESMAQLQESATQAEAKLRETEDRARQQLAAAEREVSAAKQSADSSRAQSQNTAERLRQAEGALAEARNRADAMQEEKQATEQAMAISVGAQEEQIVELVRRLEEAQAQAQAAVAGAPKSQQSNERVAQLQESLRVATEQKAVAERKLARSENSARELSRRAEQAVAAKQAAEETLSQTQAAAAAANQSSSRRGGGGASKQEQEEASRRVAAAEAEKRRLQQELASAHRQAAGQNAEIEKLKALVAETKQRAARAAAAMQRGGGGPGGAELSPKQKQKQEQKQERLLQGQKEMEGKLRKAWSDLKNLQKRNTELLSEVQEATAAAQAASADAEAARSSSSAPSARMQQQRGGASMRMQPAGQASPLAHLSYSGGGGGGGGSSGVLLQSTWGPTAAAVAAAVIPDGSFAAGGNGGAVSGWESRESAKESIEAWLEHAMDVVGSSVHVTTRDERKEWAGVAAKLTSRMESVTARTFTKVASDEELAALAAATHSSLQTTPGTCCISPRACALQTDAPALLL